CGIWDPGILSYFSGRQFVSFDPLISAVDYQRPEVMIDPISYVRQQQVAYMFGVADLHAGQWRYVPLPPGTFDIVWLPYPDHDLGWQSPTGEQVHCVVVRPHGAAVPEFLTADDFPCGLLYPNDPARRRWITRDRDRLLAGVELQADTLRLQLAVPAAGAPLQLVVDGAAVRTFA